MKRFAMFIICFLPAVLSSPALAEMKTFVKDYTYQASEEDSRNSSRTISLREVKRLLLEELGIYLESETEVKDFQLTKDQITTLTAGIVQTEIVEEKWDGRTYWLKARIAADSGEVIKSIDTLRKDRQKTKELEEVRRRSEGLLKENERLRQELLTAKGEKKQKDTAAYTGNIKDLTVAELFEKGYSFHTSGSYNDAIYAYGKAIELDPKYAMAYNNRGAVYDNIGNYSQAIKDFDKAIELSPNYAIAYYNRGGAYKSLGNYSQAIKDYDRAIDLNPKYVEAYYNRGNAYGSLGNYSQEIKDYDKAIELNPNDEEAYNNRGAAYRSLGNYSQAIKDYDRAIDLNPKYAGAYYNRGIAYGRLGNYNQAVKDCDKAIELNPKLAEAYINRGAAYYSLDNYSQALKDFGRAIELNPKLAKAYYNRGKAYNSLGNYNQAIADMKIAARLGLQEAQDFLRGKGISW